MYANQNVSVYYTLTWLVLFSRGCQLLLNIHLNWGFTPFAANHMFQHIGMNLSVVSIRVKRNGSLNASVKLLKSFLCYSLTTLHIIKLPVVVVVLEAVKYEAV